MSQLVELPAGRELDALVHLRLFGAWDDSRCRICGWPIGSLFDASKGCIPGNCSMRPAPAVRADEPSPYSTDIAQAWRVVAEVQRRQPGWRFGLLGGDVTYGYRNGKPSNGVDRNSRVVFGWNAEFFGHVDPRFSTGERHGEAFAETPAHAICLAALSALENTTVVPISSDEEPR